MKQQITIAMLSGLLAAACNDLRAQPYLDLFQVVYSTSPGNAGQPKTFNHFRAQANLPHVFKKDSSLFLFNPIWDQRRIQADESSRTYNLQGLITWFNYTRNLGPKWSLQLSFITRWMGEPSLQFSEGFQPGGAFLFTRKVRPGLKYQFGAYYNRELFGNFFLPLLGIDWKINNRMNLYGILPGFLMYENRFSKRFSWGGNFRTFTSSYRINQQGDPAADDYLRVQDNQLGVYTDWYLSRRIVANLEAGHTILRRLSTGLEGVRTRKDESILSDRDNFYFRATLQYRMRFR